MTTEDEPTAPREGEETDLKPDGGETAFPALSKKERDRRWQRTRKMMREGGLDCLLVFGLKGREQFDRVRKARIGQLRVGERGDSWYNRSTIRG